LRCGEKCFIVEFKNDEQKVEKQILARSPAEARKKIRNTVGKDTYIYSSRLKK